MRVALVAARRGREDGDEAFETQATPGSWLTQTKKEKVSGTGLAEVSNGEVHRRQLCRRPSAIGVRR